MSRRRVGLIAAALMATLAVVVVVVVTSSVRHLETAPMVRSDAAPLTVERGTSFARVADQLAERDLIDHPLALRLYARWQDLANRIQAGEYAISAGLTAAGLVQRMVQGRVIEYEITLVEGWRVDEVLAAIRRHPQIRQTLPAGVTHAALMSAIGRPGEAAEGRFLPETYRFPRGETDVEILRRANRDLESTLASIWAQRAQPTPLDSPDELLTLASIIEKETGQAAERRRIAGVFVRRLRQGMRLQTDPTVIYGLGERFDGDLLRRHLRTDNPYNTYTRHGLPPTPIALAGRAAIEAAADPAAGDSLYFVSRGDGSHVFSDTLEAHNRAVRRYQLGEGD
ncbi:endolytic transglycosylase MltG [Gammaproteobacteria bacterium 2W06]|nr:endolytic transglycosylase MltG [Gammaproteobacteria bacterium 2W06]